MSKRESRYIYFFTLTLDLTTSLLFFLILKQTNLSAKLKRGTHDKLHDYLSLVGGWERTEPGCWWKNETLPREFVICDLLGK